MRFLHVILILCCCILFILPMAGQQKGQKKIELTDNTQRLKWFEEHQAMKSTSPFKDLKWRFIGPDMISGRCTDIAVPKGDKMTIYVGAATGGVWKTTNAGISWEPIFDDAPSISVGDLAVADSDPNIVWVGTGEANIFRASVAGTGIYKSTDAGKTWKHMGLEGSHTIARIVIHPTNPNIIYVAASGNEWTYNPDCGVYKTTDGGNTWTKSLYLNEKIGCIDLAMDPSDGNTLYASMLNRIRKRWSDPVPEGEDGIYKTTDAGKTWKEKTKGLPDTKFTGRVGIDISRNKPNVLYAYVDNHTPGKMPSAGELDSYGRPRTTPKIVGAQVYRSDDKAETWVKVNDDAPMMEGFGGTYGWVFGQIRVDPNNENVVYLMGLFLARSTDGGKTFQYVGRELHMDHHALWIDPENSNYIINANDGGIGLSYDYGKTWRTFIKELPVIQFYNVAYDMEKPFNVYGSVQDHFSHRGNVMHNMPRRGGPATRWESCPGGEGSMHAIDTSNSKIVYSSTFYGNLTRAELQSNGTWRNKNILPKIAAGEAELRGEWLAPTILSPHNSNVLYHGMQYVYRSMNRGETWERISPDLTYNDPQKQGKLPYAISHQCLTQISESPFKFGLLYTGTDDGRVHLTTNSGETWKEITGTLPYNKHVSRIEASMYDPATVYLTLNGRRDDDFNDYIYKSTDYGKSWIDISGNIPGGPVNVIREDPKNKDILYVGTDLGVYVTVDGGKQWSVVANGLPNCFVWDLIIHPRDNSLVIATNGRGMWVIDNVEKIQKYKPQ
ncbi:MAG: hypothetical protein V1799_22000 [bacterium]